MKGYFIDSDSMQELWARITEIDLENVNEVRDALGFVKGILYPIKLGNYEEVKLLPESEKMRNAGMSEISETEIKAMTKEQNYMRGYKDGKSDVLDKIRAEIKEESKFCPLTEGLERALEIIDKCMAESEEV